MRIALSVLMAALLAAASTPGADPETIPVREGSIKGRVVDEETQAPIMGASVVVTGTQKGAATDDRGSFTLARVPEGSYSVSVRSLGYKPVSLADVIVRRGRITTLEVELPLAAIEVQDIVVTAGYFSEAEDHPTSTTSYSSEEIRRAPGSAGDVSRIVMALPSIAKVDDQLNSLVVRGGAPNENAFYVDNIEIPNINHYPLQGSSGGPIGLLLTDFVEDVEFTAGGFSAAYGDRLSSVMNIDFREGNRDEHDFQADFHFAGAGLVGEGPIGHGKGSWMLAARRSYLDLLVDAIGTGVAPRYSDYQGKVVYDVTPAHTLTALGVLGLDYIDFDRESSLDDDLNFYGKHEGYEYAAGLNWRALWGRRGFSNTSVSLLTTRYKGAFYETDSQMQLTDEHSTERTAQLRNVNTFRVSENHQFEFGVEAKYLFNTHDFYRAPYTNVFGDSTPPLTVNRDLDAPMYGAFVSYRVRPTARLTATLGGRYDYSDYTGRSHLSPRLSLTYALSERTSLTGASGIYHQNLPMALLSQDDDYKNLRDPMAYHYVLGVKYLLAEDTRLTVEVYDKEYHHLPLDPQQPELSIADEAAVQRLYYNLGRLDDNGRARSYGVEVTLQKKLVRGVYGLISGAYFRALYRDYDGTWRRRLFDNRVLFTVEGGYKPNKNWEFSVRWIYAGGTPYTPVDIAASRALDREVLDQTRVNAERKPDYHSLNVRVDHRFSLFGANVVAYISVWNAYDRKNVSTYYWNEADKKQDVMFQWSMLPVGGFEIEF